MKFIEDHDTNTFTQWVRDATGQIAAILEEKVTTIHFGLERPKPFEPKLRGATITTIEKRSGRVQPGYLCPQCQPDSEAPIAM